LEIAARVINRFRCAAEQQCSSCYDSHQSDVCAYLSVILLLGLALNAALGWWWADPIAALAMLPIVIREGIAGWCGKTCSHAHF
jgi:hypothetical protein